MLFQLVTARCKLLQMHCKSIMHKSVDPSDVLGGGNVSSINYCGFTVSREPLYRGYRGYRGHRSYRIKKTYKVNSKLEFYSIF